MSSLRDTLAALPLAPHRTVIGLLWTGAVVALLARGQDGPLRRRWSPLLTGPLLGLALHFVTAAISSVEALAGGLRILDARYPYGAADVLAFASALGPAGRAAYAAFQLGYDTWAPPAFAGFVASVACSTLPRASARLPLCAIWAYLASVLLANALMPVVMLSYPQLDAPVLQLLLHGVPLLDGAKYTLHIIAWLLIALGWARLLRERLHRPHRGQDR